MQFLSGDPGLESVLCTPRMPYAPIIIGQVRGATTRGPFAGEIALTCSRTP